MAVYPAVIRIYPSPEDRRRGVRTTYQSVCAFCYLGPIRTTHQAAWNDGKRHIAEVH